VALWVWHLPALYQAALGNAAIHAIEHTCFLATACLFWWALIHGRYGRVGYGAVQAWWQGGDAAIRISPVGR